MTGRTMILIGATGELSMRAYLMVRPRLLKDIPEQAKRAEALGYDGIKMV